MYMLGSDEIHSLTLYWIQDAFVDDKFRSKNEERANHDRGTGKNDHGRKPTAIPSQEGASCRSTE